VSGRGAAPLVAYDAVKACINHAVFANDVLPRGAGEFASAGLDRSYWGGIKHRTEAPAATWGPGYYESWGRHQYDTFMGDPSDGTGLPSPFSVVKDTGAPGAPRALRISAMPIPSPQASALTIMQNDQYVVAHATSPFVIPEDGASLTVNVDHPSGAQNDWHVGIGYRGAPVTFIGTLTSGGATPSGNGTGGRNPWTISDIHLYSGMPFFTLTPGVNDEGGFRSYAFPQYYAGTLDTDIDQQYGFFVARMRLPEPLPGLSPAFWMLETGGVGNNNGKLLRSEYDIEEQFGALYGYDLNAGNILWNSNDPGPWYSYGCGERCGDASGTTAHGSTGVYPWPSGGNYNNGYHDYGVLIEPGGPPPPSVFTGVAGGNYVENNSPWSGTTFFLDGSPIAGHTGEPDLTQGSPDKEIMLSFQVAAPFTFTDPNAMAASNPWPQYLYVQWLRVFRRSHGSC
jgi:hypothetical protein